MLILTDLTDVYKCDIYDGTTRHGQASRQLLNNREFTIFRGMYDDITCHTPLSYVYHWIYHGTIYLYALVFVKTLHL